MVQTFLDIEQYKIGFKLATQLLVAKHTFLGYGIIMQGQHFTLYSLDTEVCVTWNMLLPGNRKRGQDICLYHQDTAV